MTDPDPSEPGIPGARLAALSRRAFLNRTLQAGAATIAVGLVAAGCSNDDKGAFATTSSAAAASTTAAGTSPDSGDTATTDAASTDTAAADSGTAGGTLAGSETAIRFTYTAVGGGGRIENPYIATWIESEAGDLVATLALWFGQDEKGSRYLHELRRWYSVDGSDATVQTISGATRTPGDYSLAWDGTSFGKPAPEGTYYVCIEAAREHGPYSLIREAVTFGTDAFTKDLPDEGELSGASVEFTPA